MKIKLLFATFLVGLFALTSCSKDETEAQPKDTSTVIDASGTDWKYFSFSKGKEVSIAEPITSKDWDIAFNRYYVKLNGGDSGKGQAEALKTDKLTLEEVTEVPALGYSKDTQGVMLLGMPPKPTQESFCALISGGIKGANTTGYVTIDMLNMATGKGDIYAVTKYVYIVKAADRTPFKLQFTAYTNDKGKGGYPTFNYVKL